MKYLMVAPGLCVQPTIKEPQCYRCLAWCEPCRLFDKHLACIKKLPTTCTLKKGVWFEGREQKQWRAGEGYSFFSGDLDYDQSEPKDRRIVIVPVEQKDVASVHQDSSPVASHSSASGNSDEPLREFFKLSSIPVVDRYFKETNSIYHDYKYQVAIEKFAAWLRDGQTPLQKSAQKTIDIGYHGNFTAMQILADQCNAHDTGLESIQQKAAIRAMEIYASNKLPNSEQNVQERDARKADQGTEDGNQKSEPVEQEGSRAYEVYCKEYSQIVHATSLIQAVKIFESVSGRRDVIFAEDVEYAKEERRTADLQSLKQSDAVELVKLAFSEGYDSAMHHENFDKAWKEFQKEHNL